MRKSEKNKTDKFNQIGKRIEKLTDLYDNTGRDDVIVDGNELKLESQLRKEIEQRERRKVPNWQLMKEVAQDKARKGNTKELNDLLKIERKMKKNEHSSTYSTKRSSFHSTTTPRFKRFWTITTNRN